MGFPKLYAIADRETLDRRGVSVRAFAEELREGGVRLVQYRDKQNGPQEVLRAAGEIGEVFEGSGATLILNDRADLAALLGWGCHVGQGDLPVPAVRRMVRGVVGVSTHTVEQVSGAEAGAPDYVAVGPVYGTVTKLDAEPAIGLDGVRAARGMTERPLVAIGGITLENAGEVRDAGADSVAVISGLFVPGRTVREVAEDFLARLR